MHKQQVLRFLLASSLLLSAVGCFPGISSEYWYGVGAVCDRIRYSFALQSAVSGHSMVGDWLNLPGTKQKI